MSPNCSRSAIAAAAGGASGPIGRPCWGACARAASCWVAKLGEPLCTCRLREESEEPAMTLRDGAPVDGKGVDVHNARSIGACSGNGECK
jgi:hypothetical protein